MSAETHSAPPLGEAGETCRECGHPLATDQRYCLNCGRRRGEPRVDFRRNLPAEAAASTNGAARPAEPAAASPVPAQHTPQRDYAPLAAVGGIAVLGLMLLVGVLIGKGDSGSSTPPPQVVRLGEEGAGPAASEEGGKGQSAGAKKGIGQGSAKTAKNAGGSAGSQGTGNAVVAGDQELQALQEQSPEEYQESSAKLPDEIATGGAPPAKDNKAPGGGSKGTAIE